MGDKQKGMTGEIVTRNNLQRKKRVINEDGAIGRIIKCKDLHNVYIKYGRRGAGFYCFAEDCPENSEDHPLYYIE